MDCRLMLLIWEQWK